ncbi:T9SS type A sorting domain-containing protein [bacterium]|nr:T9SS type A sorting domain-containing protein [bacterium]
MNLWVRLIIVILFCHFTVTAQTHFSAVPQTGLPYTIIITNATLNNQIVVSGTELAVFDDTLCVGAVVYQDTFPVQITAWQASPSYGLQGFTPGNSMLFKMYTQNPLGLWFEGVAGTVYETGNGNFGYGAFSALALITTMVKVGEKPNHPVHFEVNAYPNPFNNQVNFNISGLPDGEFTFMIYSISGQEIYTTNGWNNNRENRLLAWFGQTTDGKTRPSGLYLFALKGGNYHYNGRVTFQK